MTTSAGGWFTSGRTSTGCRRTQLRRQQRERWRRRAIAILHPAAPVVAPPPGLERCEDRSFSSEHGQCRDDPKLNLCYEGEHDPYRDAPERDFCDYHDQCRDDPELDLGEHEHRSDGPELDLCDNRYRDDPKLDLRDNYDGHDHCRDDPELDRCDDVKCRADPELDLCDDHDQCRDPELDLCDEDVWCRGRARVAFVEDARRWDASGESAEEEEEGEDDGERDLCSDDSELDLGDDHDQCLDDPELDLCNGLAMDKVYDAMQLAARTYGRFTAAMIIHDTNLSASEVEGAMDSWTQLEVIEQVQDHFVLLVDEDEFFCME